MTTPLVFPPRSRAYIWKDLRRWGGTNRQTSDLMSANRSQGGAGALSDKRLCRKNEVGGATVQSSKELKLSLALPLRLVIKKKQLLFRAEKVDAIG